MDTITIQLPFISIKGLKQPFTFTVSESETVKSAKIHLHNILRSHEINLPIEFIRLTFNGEELKDESTFAEQSVCQNCVVHAQLFIFGA